MTEQTALHSLSHVHPIARAEALAADGLRDVTPVARTYGFELPVAVDEGAWGVAGADVDALATVLSRAASTARRATGSRARFDVELGAAGIVELEVSIGHSSDGDLAVTIERAPADVLPVPSHPRVPCSA